MTQEYARVSVEMPENEDKKSLHQELIFEIENNDIKDEFTIKFFYVAIQIIGKYLLFINYSVSIT